MSPYLKPNYQQVKGRGFYQEGYWEHRNQFEHKLYYLWINCEIKLVQVLDEVECNFNLKGDFKLKDLETREAVRAFVDKVTKRRYMKKKKEHTEKLKWIAGSLGAKFYSLSSDKPIFDSVYEVLVN